MMFDAILGFDYTILDWIQSTFRCDFLDPVMTAISAFASKGLGWILLSALFLIPKKTRKAGIIALASMLIGVLVANLCIKNLVGRQRPYELYERFHNAAMPFLLPAGPENDPSFPSGHTCCSFAAATAYFCVNKKIGIAAYVGAALIAFSRLYVYVHFPSDVLAGMLVGILSAIAAWQLYKVLRIDKKFPRLNPNP